MSRKRRWKTAIATSAVVVSAAGCTSDATTDVTTAPNSITIGIAEPQHLIPSNTTESNGAQVLSSLFYPLVNFDAKSAPVPMAAESITHDPTNKVWTVKLKPGFTFSNGEPVTSDNYLNAWNYAAYGPNGQRAAYYFERIDGYADLQSVDPDGPTGPKVAPAPKSSALSGLRKVDNTTFTVTLSAPFSGWESVLGYTAFYPLPNAAWKSPGVLADGFEDHIIGNGPFKLTGSWQHDQQLAVERVADFHGTAPKVAGITWKIYRQLQDQYADLTAGHLDIDTKIPVEDLSSATKALGDRLQKSPSSSFAFVGFPTFEKEYANKDVRRALSMAINRQQMTDQIFLGTQTPATSFVSPVVAGYRPDACGASCVYNPTEAQKLYAAAGGPPSIQIAYNTDGGHQAWVDAMCAQIKASLSVNCVGSGEPKFADLLTKVESQQPVGLVRLSWVMDYPLMESYLDPLYGTGGSSNYYGYSNPAFDSLVKEGSEAANQGDAIKKWQAAEDILAQDMPVIPLRFGQNVFGFSTRVRNVSMDTFERVDIYQVEKTS